MEQEESKKILVNVVMESTAEARADKIDTIKILREELGLDLTTAKNMVDNTPSILKTNMDISEAKTLKKRLESVGATVIFKAVDGDAVIDDSSVASDGEAGAEDNESKKEKKCDNDGCGCGCLIVILVIVFLLIRGCGSGGDDSDKRQSSSEKIVKQVEETQEEKERRELQKKYDDQAKYEEWIAWQKREEEKKLEEERQKKEIQKLEEEKRAAEEKERNLKLRNEKAKSVEIEQKRITPEKYNSISMGMTINDVVNVMGFRGSEERSGMIADQSVSIYTFYGSNDVIVQVSLVNGRVTAKAQSGL